MEITDPAAGTQHDMLNVGGNLNPGGGVLRLAFDRGFAPSAGQQFGLFNAAGAFVGPSAIEVNGLLPGWEFTADFNSDPKTFALRSLNSGIAVAPVPLPASGWLLAGGMVLVALRLRRQRHSLR